MHQRALTIAVFAASFLILGWNAGAPGLTTSYVDPIGKIVAQDEALYAASSLYMADHGDYLTPRFLGRLALYKPPVLYWLSAAGVKIVGRNSFAVRLPSILAGAATVTLIFAMLRMATSVAAALTGAILLIGSHLFFVMSRVGLTDALLTAEIAAAMYALWRDPRLASSRWRLTFGVATGAAIMTKSTAGLFPILILVAFCAISKERPTFTRLLQAVAIAAAVALPWHLWQLATHPRWFWNEYIMTEQIGWGLGAKIQSTNESPAGYYLKRLLWLDPVLALAAVAALIKRRPRLLIAWIVVVLLGCAVFQYRNTSYLLPVYPALSLLVAGAIPPRFAKAALVAAAALFVTKAASPPESWAMAERIPFGAETVNPSLAKLDEYRQLHRANDLIIIEPDDQFYSADIGLPHVRYVYIDPSGEAMHAPLDFGFLGITLNVDQFQRLNQLRPMFAERLREWNLDSDDAIATVILARNRLEEETLIAAHPEADYLVPGPSGHVILLSSKKIERP
jgi:hypothetical protein